MQVQPWQPGMTVADPVYLDSNIWVASAVNGHRLYRAVSRLFADLLTAQSRILFSQVNYSEALWAIAKMSYADLQGHSANKKLHFDRGIYRKHRANIWQHYGARFSQIGSTLQAYSAAGVPVESVPPSSPMWLSNLGQAPGYMNTIGLEATDAIHLALADSHARTFVTADQDFLQAVGAAPQSNLVILHVV